MAAAIADPAAYACNVSRVVVLGNTSARVWSPQRMVVEDAAWVLQSDSPWLTPQECFWPLDASVPGPCSPDPDRCVLMLMLCNGGCLLPRTHPHPCLRRSSSGGFDCRAVMKDARAAVERSGNNSRMSWCGSDTDSVGNARFRNPAVSQATRFISDPLQNFGYTGSVPPSPPSQGGSLQFARARRCEEPCSLTPPPPLFSAQSCAAPRSFPVCRHVSSVHN